MKTSTALPLALALGLSFAGLLAACDNSLPVYASIQEEQPGAKEGLFYRASVGGVLTFGGKYYAQRSTLAVSSSGTEGSWSTVSIAGLGTDYACTGLATDGTALYAAINGKGLYSSSDGSSWSQALTDTIIDSVYGTATGTVFVVDHDEKGTATVSSDDVWTLATVSGGVATPLTLTGFVTAGTPIGAVAYDATDYWVITGDGIYSSSGAAGPFAKDGSGNAPIGKLSSIYANGSGTLYVGSAAGVVYKHSGTTWATPSSSLTYAVTALCEVPTASGTRLLAGLGANSTTGTSSVSYGYSILDPAALGSTTTDSGTIASSSTNYSTTLYQKPINAFCYDGTVSPARLFAATASAGITGATGLFTATWDGSAWSGWSTE